MKSEALCKAGIPISEDIRTVVPLNYQEELFRIALEALKCMKQITRYFILKESDNLLQRFGHHYGQMEISEKSTITILQISPLKSANRHHVANPP